MTCSTLVLGTLKILLLVFPHECQVLFWFSEFSSGRRGKKVPAKNSCGGAFQPANPFYESLRELKDWDKKIQSLGNFYDCVLFYLLVKFVPWEIFFLSYNLALQENIIVFETFFEFDAINGRKAVNHEINVCPSSVASLIFLWALSP